MFDKAYSTIKEYNMIKANDCIVLGVSGGADSVALLHILYRIKDEYSLKLIVVHINHCLRGDDAFRDENFVKNMCDNLNIECFIFRCDIMKYSKNNKISLEEAGRFIRYEKFEQISKKYKNSKIAVAHNMNDQAETILMRIARGTGMGGIAGIFPVRKNIIRPLLYCSRKEIEKYCFENKLQFCTDKTNFDNIYTRNKIRLNLIPFMEKELNENTVENISKMAKLIYSEEMYLEKQSKRLLDDITFKKTENFISLNIKKINVLDDVMKRRVIRLALRYIKDDIKDISFIHISNIIKFMNKSSGKEMSLPLNIKAVINYENIEFYLNINTKDSTYCQILEINKIFFIKKLNKYVLLSLNQEKKNIKSNNVCTKSFDYDKIKNEIVLRTRQAGDRIYFNGGSKKLKDFFIDEKIPRNERENTILIADGNNIIFIYPKRTSSFYHISSSTKNILYIQIWEGAENEREN